MTFQKSDDPIKRKRQSVKMLQKALGIDDATYREMLMNLTGKTSCTELDMHGLNAVIDFLSHGTKPKPRWFATCEDPVKGPMSKKVWAMLKESGRSDAYVDAMAKRMFGRDRFEWCLVEEMHKIVQALVIDQQRRQREGTKPPERAA